MAKLYPECALSFSLLLLLLQDLLSSRLVHSSNPSGVCVSFVHVSGYLAFRRPVVRSPYALFNILFNLAGRDLRCTQPLSLLYARYHPSIPAAVPVCLVSSDGRSRFFTSSMSSCIHMTSCFLWCSFCREVGYVLPL